jgi:hypothetical protein
MNTKTENNHRTESAPTNTRSKTEREEPVIKRQINTRVSDSESRLATQSRSAVETPALTDIDEKAGRGRKDSAAPRLDPRKLKIQFCAAAKAERIAKGAVLRDLRRRANSAGKKVNGGTESIVGPKRCLDVRWLWGTLNTMADEFALLIDEDLEKLNQPGADRETLVGMIYTHLLCIRATVTIFMGDD